MGSVPFEHIAALGSSFAAGPGIKPIVDRWAGRSGRNYAHLLAAMYGARLTDLSVGGATTSTMLDTEQRVLWHRFAPQVTGVPDDADLVTITAGGNDLNYAGSLIKAGYAGWFRRRAIAGVVPLASPELIAQAAGGLARVVDAARARAPRARVVLAQYPTIIGPHTGYGPAAPFDAGTLAEFRELGKQLDEAFEQAATKSGADLVRVGEASEDHAIGSAEPWVTGFKPSLTGAAAFHPNAAGMVAIAELIEKQLG